MNLILKKGYQLKDTFEIQFQICTTRITNSYRAKNKEGELVRIDLINLGVLPSSYFDQEGKLLYINILEAIENENLPKIIEWGEIRLENERYAYIILKFIPGETIAEKIKREGILSPYSAVPIVIELLETLEYLHGLKNPIVHNSINPDAIKLDYLSNRDKPILTNFENARVLGLDEKKVSMKFLPLFYTSPELLSGIYSPKSDIYAVGALLYYTIMGEPPYYNENILTAPLNEQRVLMEAQRERGLNFTFVDEDLIDDHLKNAITKSLMVDPRERFDNVVEFIKVLKREVVLELSNKSKQYIKAKATGDKKKEMGFNKIAGMEKLKKELKEDVIDYLNNPELYEKYKIPMLNGILFFGPPGCGKTFIAENFAAEVGYNFVLIKPSDLQSKYINQTQENIGKLFKEAYEKAPTIIFLDELDALVPSREDNLHQMHAAAVNEVLAQMTNCGEKDVFVIGATNRPEKIDSAILRTGRLDKAVYIPPPDLKARITIFKIYLKDRPTDLDVDYAYLGEKTDNYVTSDLKFMIDQAAKRAMKSKSRITMEMLVDVIKNTQPSVTLTEIKKYERYKKEWDDERRRESGADDKPTFGFTINN
jgi:transitional endoplasmic reticulum ATPase